MNSVVEQTTMERIWICVISHLTIVVLPQLDASYILFFIVRAHKTPTARLLNLFVDVYSWDEMRCWVEKSENAATLIKLFTGQEWDDDDYEYVLNQWWWQRYLLSFGWTEHLVLFEETSSVEVFSCHVSLTEQKRSPRGFFLIILKELLREFFTTHEFHLSRGQKRFFPTTNALTEKKREKN